MSDNRICKLPCSQYKPDGPTDLGVGGWCLEHHDPCLLVDCQRRDIIEAVLEDRYSHVPNEDKGYMILAIQTDKPCPTCGGRGYCWQTAHDSHRNSRDEYDECPTCKGSGKS